MNNHQTSLLGMYLSFRDFQSAYTVITNPLPNYTANLTTFLNAVTQIQAAAEQQKISKKGVTEVKNNLKDGLIVATVDYARKLGVYAKFTNNTILAQEVKITESKLRRVGDTAVKDYAQIMYDRAQTNVAALAAYGITATTQTSFLNAINIYNASIGKPGATRIESGQTTKQLVSLFNTANNALDNMDAAVEIVRISQPAFYTGYKSARKVGRALGSSIAVKGVVTDAITGEYIKNAKLSFVPDGVAALAESDKASSKPVVVKKSAKRGGFIVRSLQAGVYTVTIERIGYARDRKSVV